MSRIIAKVVVNKADAYCKESVTLTSGMAGSQLEFEFSNEWAGLGRTAVFTAGSTTKYVVLSATSNVCDIPAECLTTARQLVVCGVYGTNSDGTVVIPTVNFALGLVNPGTEVSGSEPSAITPTLYQQVSAALNSAETELALIKETAVKSVDADSTQAGVVGTPTVTVATEWIDSADHSKGKKAIFTFKNLKGERGANGSDATVTATNIRNALGYTPANPSDFATVATSGAYDDLSGKPTIPTVPTNVSAFTNDSDYVTSAYHDTSKADAEHTHVMEDITDLPSIPTSAEDLAYGESNVKDALDTHSANIVALQTTIGDNPETDTKWQSVAEKIEEANDGYSALVDLCILLPQAFAGDQIKNKIDEGNAILNEIIIKLEEGLRL